MKLNLKKVVYLFMVLVALLLSATACGGSNNINQEAPLPQPTSNSPGETTNTSAPATSISGPFHTTIAAGSQSSYAITNDGSLWGWGLTGIEYGPLRLRSQYSPIHILDHAVSVHSQGSRAVAITEDGILWEWGEHGMRPYPVAVLEDVILADVSNFQALAVTADGHLWTWGNNRDSALGDGTTENRLHPEIILDDVVFASFLPSGGIAIKSDGSTWFWGVQHQSVNGEFVREEWETPHLVEEERATMVSRNTLINFAGYEGYLRPLRLSIPGVTSIGGDVRSSSLDSGMFIIDRVPSEIEGSAIVSTVSGLTHMLALTENGRIWSWGRNAIGELGNGTTIDHAITVSGMLPGDLPYERVIYDGFIPIFVMDNVRLP